MTKVLQQAWISVIKLIIINCQGCRCTLWISRIWPNKMSCIKNQMSSYSRSTKGTRILMIKRFRSKKRIFLFPLKSLWMEVPSSNYSRRIWSRRQVTLSANHLSSPNSLIHCKSPTQTSLGSNWHWKHRTLPTTTKKSKHRLPKNWRETFKTGKFINWSALGSPPDTWAWQNLYILWMRTPCIISYRLDSSSRRSSCWRMILYKNWSLMLGLISSNLNL